MRHGGFSLPYGSSLKLRQLINNVGFDQGCNFSFQKISAERSGLVLQNVDYID